MESDRKNIASGWQLMDEPPFSAGKRGFQIIAWEGEKQGGNAVSQLEPGDPRGIVDTVQQCQKEWIDMVERLLEAQPSIKGKSSVLQFARQDKYQVSARIEITSFNFPQTPPPPTAKAYQVEDSGPQHMLKRVSCVLISELNRLKGWLGSGNLKKRVAKGLYFICSHPEARKHIR